MLKNKIVNQVKKQEQAIPDDNKKYKDKIKRGNKEISRVITTGQKSNENISRLAKTSLIVNENETQS